MVYGIYVGPLVDCTTLHRYCVQCFNMFNCLMFVLNNPFLLDNTLKVQIFNVLGGKLNI